MSKGSKRRPKQVSEETEAENWARIFGMREKERKPKEKKVNCHAV